MTDAHFYIYNVGHGVCTLLTGIKESDHSPYCGIFDCGTKAQHDLLDIESVIEDMRRKIQDIKTDHIDDVVISHQDVDHWNKFVCLFSGLNGKKITLPDSNNILFGRKKEKVWKLINGRELYTIEDQKYVKEYKTCSYEYTAKAKYNETDLVSLRVTIDPYSEPQIVIYYTYQFDHDISLQIGQCSDYIKMHGRIKKITEQSVINAVLQCVSGKNSISALEDIGSSFTPKRRKQLDDDFNSDNIIDIEFPINRVIMGGTKIKEGYNIFKSFLWGVLKLYGREDDFLWEENGAYISMTENDVEAKTRDFPNQSVLHNPPRTDSVMRNLTSVVVQFNIKDDDVLLLPGDVTVHALQIIANIVDSIPPKSLKLFLAPHHGSDSSNLIYNSDHDLEDEQPLANLFRAIRSKQSTCNLVISGYNKTRKHPGVSFVEIAMDYFYHGPDRHSIASAKEIIGNTDGKSRETIMSMFVSSLKKMGKETIRIFTTNCLSTAVNCYDYHDGIVSGRTFFFNERKRKLPPDNSFM